MKQKKRTAASVEVLAPVVAQRVRTRGLVRGEKPTAAAGGVRGKNLQSLSEAKRLSQIAHLHDRGTDKLLAALRGMEEGERCLPRSKAT